MTNETTPTSCRAPAASARFATAGSFLESLAAQDFRRLGSSLSADVDLKANLPRGFDDWTGATDVEEIFTRWFGHTEAFELTDATVGEVGGRLALRWRARMRAERLGEGTFVIEQQAFVDTDADDRICRIALLCSGFRRENERFDQQREVAR